MSIQPIPASVLRSLSLASLIAASALLVAPPLQAQTTAAAEAPVRDAAVLKRMAEVGAFLRAQKIASFKLPERLEVVSQFPLSPVGKILKRALREMIAARMEDERARARA